MSDIVERLTANTDKYPGFQNLNTEAAAEITRLRASLAAWDGYFKGHMYQKTHSLGVERQIEDEMNAKYGVHQKDTRNG